MTRAVRFVQDDQPALVVGATLVVSVDEETSPDTIVPVVVSERVGTVGQMLMMNGMMMMVMMMMMKMMMMMIAVIVEVVVVVAAAAAVV